MQLEIDQAEHDHANELRVHRSWDRRSEKQAGNKEEKIGNINALRRRAPPSWPPSQ
jgi:hypothetical protein